MRKTILLALLIAALVSSCISQEEEKDEPWTLEEWRNHIVMVNPNIDQSINNMAAGLVKTEEFPVGTRMVFEADAQGSMMGMDIPIDMTMVIEVTGTEVLEGNECTVADVTMTMDMLVEEESFTMTYDFKEWVDTSGTPMKVEGEIGMKIMGMETPMKFTSQLVGEEEYQGHNCWVFEGTYITEMMGISSEMNVTQYIDKESYSLVRMITEEGEMETDNEYTETVNYVTELEWELGERETITTKLGTYDCQIIYLKDNGEIVGTIWANEEIKAPLKYTISYQVQDIEMEMTMVLVEYTWGS